MHLHIVRLLILVCILGASPAEAAGWAENYGTSGANSFIMATEVDASGNVYIAGNFDGYTLTLGTVTLNRIGSADNAFVAKLDAGGNVLWANNYGGASVTRAYFNAIALDTSGNIYLGGYFSGYSLINPVLTKIGTTGNDNAFVLKLDSSGNTTWAKNFGGSGAQAQGYAIAVDASSNVYLGGYFYNSNLTTPALTKIGLQDAFVIKLDSSGNTTWAKNYGGIGAYVYGNAIAVDASDNVYLGGYFYNSNLTSPVMTKIGDHDALVLKLDSSGNTTWAQNYGGSGAWAYGNAIAVDTSGNVYLDGSFYVANLTTPALTQIGGQDALVLKLDSSGNTTWAENFGSFGAQTFDNSIAVDNFGNVYLGGYFGNANLTTPALTLIGTFDAFATKLNSSGVITWAKNYGGSGATTIFNAIAVDAYGNSYLGGYFVGNNLTTPALTNISGSNEALIFKETATANPVKPSSIPTLSQMCRIVLSLLLAIGTFFILRRQRL